MSDTSDPIDAACAREQEWLSDQIANHALKQRFAGDIEGQVCRGCDFVTKSNYGRSAKQEPTEATRKSSRSAVGIHVI